jgi:hypothetical protein
MLQFFYVQRTTNMFSCQKYVTDISIQFAVFLKTEKADSSSMFVTSYHTT